MKKYFKLTKFGIVLFVIFTASGGYLMGHPFRQVFDTLVLVIMITGLYFMSSGSFALNQFQERNIDIKMPRTLKRPLPSGELQPKHALIFAILFLFIGTTICFYTSWKVGVLGVTTVFFYNVLYTMWWKKQSPFAAVPGAIPGAMPFSIGYTAASDLIFTWENFYFFLLMFLWQMPHFWALALRYKDDYKLGGIPVLPAERGQKATEFYVGLYTFAYLGLVFAAPFVIPVRWAYLVIAIPFAFKIYWELFGFLKDPLGKKWVGFFLWTTLSILVFIFVPAIDRWSVWLF
ncbi:MAG: protoheme IX farnesyltransferase [Bdellovibrionales bacterium]|nr:heme o synthase [Bdellovibrionales bacterium]NQZ19112.1 protoheme IX farnesyltransferase [Bdellovibrionales bacterium]